MITLSDTWKKSFWGCSAAFAILVVLSLFLRVILLFALALVVGIVICVLAMSKLRCPRCGKLILQEALKVQFQGEVVCPKCGGQISIQ